MRLANKFALVYLLGATDYQGTFGEKLRGARLLQGNKPISSCYTSNVVEVQYEDHSIEESRIECGTEDGLFYTVDLPDHVVKANKAGVANGEVAIDLPAGSAISGNKIVLPPGTKAGLKPGKSIAPPFQRHGRDLKIGERTVLVVRVIASDDATTFTQTALSNSVFGNNADGNGADSVNLKSQYAECSHGQLNFVEAAGRNNNGNIIENGSVTVTVDTLTSEGDGTMRNAITTQLSNMFGISASSLADHVMYCLPPNTMSGIAYAYINSWNSVYSNEWCTYVSGQMHEIGHNIGLAHSNEAGTYRDQTGMMGYSYSSSDSPVMCFNGAKSWQLGWYSDKNAEYDASQGQQTYRLVGQADYPNADAATQTVILRLNKLAITPSTDYYVSFNRSVGNNSGTREAANQVTIQRMGGGGTSYAESELLAKLSASGSYSIPDFDGVGELTLTVNAINTSISPGYADITVNVGVITSPPTTAPPTTPPTTATPTNSPTTGSPTSSPTPFPTISPTVPPPTSSPTTASPTSPPTPFPTNSPTPAPTPAPTNEPTPCNLAKVDESCSGGADCCSGACTGGKPASRVCLPPSGPTNPPAPTPPPAPTTASPVGSCLNKNGSCAFNSDCCSGNCKNNGRCA